MCILVRPVMHENILKQEVNQDESVKYEKTKLDNYLIVWSVWS